MLYDGKQSKLLAKDAVWHITTLHTLISMIEGATNIEQITASNKMLEMYHMNFEPFKNEIIDRLLFSYSEILATKVKEVS